MMPETFAAIARLSRSLSASAAETILAAGCPVCERALSGARGGVCRACWRELGDGGWGEPAIAAEPLEGLKSLATLAPYEGRMRRLIRALKFRGIAGAAGPLGEILGERLVRDRTGIDAVVAVPLHWRRRWRRGYNQAEWIARGLSARIERPLQPGALRRIRAGGIQAGRGRAARLSMTRGLFEAKRVAGLRMLLVDDVVTTGATLRACAGALRAAGAESVAGVAAARAMERTIISGEQGRERA